jgi:hypothetical protein
MNLSFLYLFFHSLLWAGAGGGGIEVMIIEPKFDDNHGIAFTGAFFNHIGSIQGDLENGIYFKIPTFEHTTNYAKEAFGYQVGFLFIPRFPLIRPGMNVGLVTEKWVDESGSTKWRIQPQYGVKLQISLLSFSVSSRGLGAGLNFTL